MCLAGRARVRLCLWDSNVQEDRVQHKDPWSLWGNRNQQDKNQQVCEGQSDYNESLHHRAEAKMIPQGSNNLHRAFTAFYSRL